MPGKEVIQQKMWLFDRGLEVYIPPPATEAVSTSVNQGGQTAAGERERLHLMNNHGVLKRRIPNVEIGRRNMQNIDPERSNVLLGYARTFSDHMITEWAQIQPDIPIAVVLFGSVAKGTVREALHPDPSNIDLALIGNISEDERLQLLDRIRPMRKQMQGRILSDCTNRDTDAANPGNVFVQIQNPEKLINGDYAEALELISSGAFALHDPAGIWKDIESEALVHTASKRMNKRTNRMYTKSREWEIFSRDMHIFSHKHFK